MTSGTPEGHFRLARFCQESFLPIVSHAHAKDLSQTNLDPTHNVEPDADFRQGTDLCKGDKYEGNNKMTTVAKSSWTAVHASNLHFC